MPKPSIVSSLVRNVLGRLQAGDDLRVGDVPAHSLVPMDLVGALSPPVLLTAPSITGVLKIGETLTGVSGTSTGIVDSASWQWYRDGVAIAGATSITYVVTSADANTTLTLEQTLSNSAGSSSATSAGADILSLFGYDTTTWTRASEAAYFDPRTNTFAQKIGDAWVDRGAAGDPDDFSDRTSINGTPVITANVDGAADELEDDDAGGSELLQWSLGTIAEGVRVRYTIKVKQDSDTTRFPAFRVQGGGTFYSVHLNTQTGATSSVAGLSAFDTVSVTDDGAGYWLVVLTTPALAAGVWLAEIGPARATTIGTGTGAAVGSIVCKGFVLEDDDAAYLLNNTGRIFTGGSRGVEQVTDPNDLTTGNWTANNGPTVTANDAVAPDATTTATRIAFAAGGSNGELVQSFAAGNLSGADVAISVFLRSATGAGSQNVDLLYVDCAGSATFENLTITETWTRYEFIVTDGGGIGTPSISILENTDGAEILVWGVSVREGSAADHAVLSEESRTNQLLNNQTMTAGTWSTLNSPTLTQVGSDGPDGGAYTSIAFAAGGAAGQVRQTLPAGIFAGSTVTISCFLRAASGTPDVTLYYRDTALAATTSTVTLSTSWQRFDFTITDGNSTNGPLFAIIESTDGVTVHATLPQVEEGAFPTSPIRTAGAAATRAAEYGTLPVDGWPAAIVDGAVRWRAQPLFSSAEIIASVFVARLYGFNASNEGLVLWTAGGTARTAYYSAIGSPLGQHTAVSYSRLQALDLTVDWPDTNELTGAGFTTISPSATVTISADAAATPATKSLSIGGLSSGQSANGILYPPEAA